MVKDSVSSVVEPGVQDRVLLGVVGRTGDFVLLVFFFFFFPLVFKWVFSPFGVLEGNLRRVNLK